jgi:hypothetical protein
LEYIERRLLLQDKVDKVSNEVDTYKHSIELGEGKGGLYYSFKELEVAVNAQPVLSDLSL